MTLVLLVKNYPTGDDWAIYHSASFSNPYSTDYFVAPPWVLLLLPHRVLPVGLGNAVNFLINLVVALYGIKVLGGNWKTILIVTSSPVFYEFARLNNVDWIPLLGLLTGPWLGPVFMSCKPHVFGGVVLIWAKRDWRVVLIPLSVLLLSLVIWGWWPGQIEYNPTNKSHNLCPFPIGIPFGLWLLRKAWREDDVYLAAASTSLLTPYFSVSSVTPLMVVVACRWPKAAVWLWLGLWTLVITRNRW